MVRVLVGLFFRFLIMIDLSAVDFTNPMISNLQGEQANILSPSPSNPYKYYSVWPHYRNEARIVLRPNWNRFRAPGSIKHKQNSRLNLCEFSLTSLSLHRRGSQMRTENKSHGITLTSRIEMKSLGPN